MPIGAAALLGLYASQCLKYQRFLRESGSGPLILFRSDKFVEGTGFRIY